MHSFQQCSILTFLYLPILKTSLFYVIGTVVLPFSPSLSITSVYLSNIHKSQAPCTATMLQRYISYNPFPQVYNVFARKNLSFMAKLTTKVKHPSGTRVTCQAGCAFSQGWSWAQTTKSKVFLTPRRHPSARIPYSSQSLTVLTPPFHTLEKFPYLRITRMLDARHLQRKISSKMLFPS